MITPSLARISRITAALALCAAVFGLTASPAHARVFVGVGIGVPFYGWGGWGPGFYPAPDYYPPPWTYAPPPIVYTPPPQGFAPGPGPQPGGGQACYAGPYVCPMDRPVAPGSSCYCLGNGGQRVWGRSN